MHPQNVPQPSSRSLLLEAESMLASVVLGKMSCWEVMHDVLWEWKIEAFGEQMKMKYFSVFHFFSTTHPISNSSQVLHELHWLPKCMYFSVKWYLKNALAQLCDSVMFSLPPARPVPTPSKAELLVEVSKAGAQQCLGATEHRNTLVLCSLSASLTPCWIATLLSWTLLKIYSPTEKLKSSRFSMKMGKIRVYEKIYVST